MSLKIHSGLVRIESWRPGSKGAGESATYELGNFSEDVILVGILRDPDSDAGSTSITATVEAPSPSGKRSIMPDIPTDSIIFDGGLDGGSLEMNIPIPAREKFKLKLDWAGTASVGFILLFGAPLVNFDQYSAMASKLQPTSPPNPNTHRQI